MPRPSPLRTWLQLVRAPNLLTVPGDPVAGYLLVCFGVVEHKLWPAIGASVCFYAGGLLLNDLADLAEDRRERPERPLPSGAANVAAVGAALVVLFAAALYLCWTIDRTTFATGGALLLAIVAYNYGNKRIPVVGAVNMGICRGLSMLLGATAAPHGDLLYRLLALGQFPQLVIAVAIVVGYIAAVTNLARFETRSQIPRAAKILPPAVLAVGSAFFLQQLSIGDAVIHLVRERALNGAVISALLLIVAFVNCLQVALQLIADPALPVPAQIGKLIRLQLLIQAAFCASVAALGAFFGDGTAFIATIVLVAMWPVSRLLSRSFYAS